MSQGRFGIAGKHDTAGAAAAAETCGMRRKRTEMQAGSTTGCGDDDRIERFDL
jgi:hypothetical protein